jgi:hypothetical protein
VLAIFECSPCTLMCYHFQSIDISSVWLQEQMMGPSLGAELEDVYLGMDREVCWVVVRWEGGVCHLSHHSNV